VREATLLAVLATALTACGGGAASGEEDHSTHALSTDLDDAPRSFAVREGATNG
jgi:hypothetical protein